MRPLGAELGDPTAVGHQGADQIKVRRARLNHLREALAYASDAAGPWWRGG